MRNLGFLWVTFITIFTQCNCASLEVLIDGDVAESPISCVGENITFVCTVASLGHAWTVGSFVTRQAVLANDDEDISEVEMFTFRRVSVSGGTITTSLSVLSFSDLNNVMVECIDGGGGAEEQNIVAQVYDPPVLNLTVMSSLTSFVLTPQVTNPECVITIEPVTVTPVCDDDVTREDIPVAIGMAIRVEDYDVCQCTYNFTIVATTLIDELRMTMSQDVPIDLSDAAPITGLVETRSGIAWSPPANTNGCSFDYVVTEDGSELTRTADTSYDYIFPTCRNLTLTVTPVVPSTGEVLTSSSASINVFNSSANDVLGIKPEVIVSSSVRPDGDEVDVIISWISQVVGISDNEVVEITRGDARELVVTIPVEGDLEGQYTVMDCNYVETSTTFYVRFIFGGCMSEESDAIDGFIDGLTCTGDRGSGVSSVVLTAVVSVVLFIVGVVAGFAAGWLARHCTGRSKQSTPPPPPAALYEEVVVPTTQRTQVQGELELKDNVAYGHVAL